MNKVQQPDTPEALQARIDKIVAKYEKEKVKAYGKKIYYGKGMVGDDPNAPKGMSAYRASLKQK